VIGASRFGAAVSGVTFAFCGFITASLIWPMVLGAAVWLPLALIATEKLIRLVGERSHQSSVISHRSSVISPESRVLGAGTGPQDPGLRTQDSSLPAVPIILWSVTLAVALGMQFLAGHVEITSYLLASVGFYAAGRLLLLLGAALRARGDEQVAASRRRVLQAPIWSGLLLLAIVAVAMGLAAPQLLPFAELAGQNFRSGSATYDQIVGWAYRPLQLLAFVMPDFFGNPTHHSYQDLFAAKEVAVTANYWGEPVRAIFWGTRNYIEGFSYTGILSLLLAALALLIRRDRYTWLFAGLAVMSLALSFGSPLYSVLYSWVPGYNQLHTPFRWIFPYSFAVAVLAGLGATAALEDRSHVETIGRVKVQVWEGLGKLRVVAAISVAGGLLGIMALAITPLAGDRVLAAAQSILESSSSLRRAFPDERAFFFYEFRSVAILAVLLVASGAVLTMMLHRRDRLVQGLALALIAADLFFFGMGFNAASDPKLLEFTPPALQFLQQDRTLHRITVFGKGRVLPADMTLAYGLQDVRGYDSVILRSYVDFVERLESQSLLPYNRVGALTDPKSLESPLVNLLGVRYVLTKESIDSPSFRLVYDRELKIYRNDAALPRAFLAGRAVGVATEQEALGLIGAPGFDPRATVVIETDGAQSPDISDQSSAISRQSSVVVTSYSPNRVELRADGASEGEYLVLADVYYQGWRASIDGKDAPILKADGIFRTVRLPAGSHTVVFEFKPISFQMGLFAALVALSIILLALGAAVTIAFYPKGTDSPLQRLARNSLFPMGTSLLNKLLDLALAMYTLRVLGPEGVGKYTFAVVVLGNLDIVANFGLGTLLTREVARDRGNADRYLGNTLVTRGGLWLLSMIAVALLLGPLSGPLGITPDVGLAILLLTIGLLPSLASGALSALFQAYERFEFPAGVTVVTSVLKIALSVAALASGMGFVGLAGVSVVSNAVTLAVLFGLTLAVLYRPRPHFSPRFSLDMLRLSYPLMLNNLLNSLFFRVDSLMLKPMAGDAQLGWYGTAYKFIDGLGIISSSFTLALFPMLSRHAQSPGPQLSRSFGYAIKVLLLVSLPICVGTTLIAPEIILLFAGPEYLPHSALALQILIWFLPFSFVNGVTQYVLIAINQQRFITFSFAVATVFNVAANLLLIPRYGYAGAAVTTVLSEWVLMVPFWYCVRTHLPPVQVLRIVWKPALAAAAMGAEVWLLRDWNVLAATLLAPLVYAAGLLVLRTFDEAEIEMAKKIVAR
ncbi:MAG TPA: oligosaccharide flippase family protein, partial [Chloroflexota bacterium]